MGLIALLYLLATGVGTIKRSNSLGTALVVGGLLTLITLLQIFLVRWSRSRPMEATTISLLLVSALLHRTLLGDDSEDLLSFFVIVALGHFYGLYRGYQLTAARKRAAA